MLNKKAVDFAIFQAKAAMAGFEIKLTPKGEIRGVKRGAKLGKAEAKSANNPNYKNKFSRIAQLSRAGQKIGNLRERAGRSLAGRTTT